MTVPEPFDERAQRDSPVRDRSEVRAENGIVLRSLAAVAALGTAAALWFDAGTTRTTRIDCGDVRCTVAVATGWDRPAEMGTFPVGGLVDAGGGCRTTAAPEGGGRSCRPYAVLYGWLPADPAPTEAQLVEQRAAGEAVPAHLAEAAEARARGDRVDRYPGAEYVPLSEDAGAEPVMWGPDHDGWAARTTRPGGTVHVTMALLPASPRTKGVAGLLWVGLAGLAARSVWRRRIHSRDEPLGVFDANQLRPGAEPPSAVPYGMDETVPSPYRPGPGR